MLPGVTVAVAPLVTARSALVVTVVIATHQVEHVTSLADQVITLEGGRIA